MNSKDRKLPKANAKRFGHRSHTRIDSFIRVLENTGFFDWTLKKERKKYGKS